MTFDKILDNDTLWAVRYDNSTDNALQTLFSQWSDPEWLVDFFLANMTDLESYFKITDINQAIYDTIDDNHRIQCLILDLSPEANLDTVFRPLENSRTSEMQLIMLFFLRRDGDSNPGNPFGVYTLSRRASSTTRASLLHRANTSRGTFSR